jgi:5-methylcytosine-specific restriction endonuclease McrA
MQTRSNLSLPTLVLNKAWVPISITPVGKAISKSMLGLAYLMDVDNYALHSFEAWQELQLNTNDKYIRTTRSFIKVPEIMVLADYERLPMREVRLTRRNLLIRDNYMCQYTGQKISIDEATVDHVIPRSRGGASTWENLVMCCKDVNSRKADRTPEEAGLRLLTKPQKPKWSPIYARFARLATAHVPQSWLKFITVEGNPFGWVDG